MARIAAASRRSAPTGRTDTLTHGSVRSILNNKLDRQAGRTPRAEGVSILHPSIRGPRYYH